jgi:soluble lytic murein transglycosylase
MGEHVGKRTLITALFAGLVLLWAGAAPAEIYYQVDENGIAHFTNTPTSPEARLLQPGVLPASTRLSPATMAELIRAFAIEHDLDPALIEAVIQIESNFNRKAVSRKGAQGLMQLMPATIWRFSVGDAYDPHENIGAGVRYLRKLVDQFHGDLTLALAAYNAGENAVLRYKGVPPYQETRDYVAKVLGLYRSRQGERSTNGTVKPVPDSDRGAVTHVVAATPPPPAPPPQPIYKAEASGTILYSNIPPIVQTP